ncbi:hypothetical protein F5X97DRAFT_284710 [Nemania serpens]|nr:hypothetical protein F5X97DRAFT_284710 [Nemania serpens]
MNISRRFSRLFNSEQGRSHGSVKSSFASHFRSHLRSDLNSSSNSNGSPNSYNSTWSQQTFAATRIDGDKLRDLLNRKFNGDYALTLQSDEYTIFAERGLSEEEILSCALRRQH